MTISRPRTIPPRRRPPSPRLGRVGTQGGRAAFLATGPTAWYDARDLLSTSQQTLVNRVGTSTATLGSTGTSDTNDPVALTYDGSAYVYLPGTASNYLSVPDAAALDIVGDLDLRAEVTLNSWTSPAVQSAFISKYLPTGNQRSYQFSITTSGVLNLAWSTDGIAVTQANASTALFTSAQTRQWVRVTLDVNNGSGGYDVTFYTSTNGSTWTQVGTTVTGGSTTSVFSGSAPCIVGSSSFANNTIDGRVHRAIVKNGIDGTTVLDINPAVETLGQSSWTCTTGQTVTVNRATSGLTTAVVTRPLLMADGTDDYVQLPAGDTPTFTATTGAYTVMLINRVHNLAGVATFSRAWSSEGGASNTGAQITLDSTNARYLIGVGGAVTAVNPPSPVAFTAVTQLHAVALVYSAGTIAGYSTTTGLTGTTSTTGVGTITHTSPRLWTRAYTVSDNADLETHAVAVWNGRALTATELDTAATYLLGTYT